MLKKIIYSIIFVLGAIPVSQGQSGPELMINGGFEYIDVNIPIQPPYPQGSSPIYRATPWDNVHNTCDVHNSSYATPVIGSPKSGTGCGRFVAPISGAPGGNEFCVGETNQLVAGETYIVSFWVRKDFDEDREVPIGVVASESIPSIQTSPTFSSSQPVDYTITPLSTQYVQGSFCFTAQNSVKYYITFGPWIPDGGNVTLGFYLDDVSVKALDAGTPLPTADVTIPQTTFCVGDNIIVDGSNSLNGDTYTWEVYQLVNNGNQESFEYSTGPLTGQPSTFDVSSVINPSPGDCYRVYLTNSNICSESYYVDFCYVDPNIDFIHDGSAICENTPLTLSVTGDNGWTYDWSTGDSGVGLKTLTVTPTLSNSTYSVTVTTPEGCTHTETINLTVHSANNLAPWMDGINGSGDYTIYVNQGNAANFISTFFNDNGSETLEYDLVSSSLPVGTYSLSLPSDGTQGGTMQFSMGASVNEGTYSISVSAEDDNACSPEAGTFTYTVIVVCPTCPLCIVYTDERSPTGIPLPPETRAGQCIVAGFADPISTGNDPTVFRAGDFISLGPNWNAGPGYQGIIEPNTCVTDCDVCCNNWTGFTYDPIPTYSIIDINDNDPTNDIFQVTDADHPFCAYNATGYYFEVWQDEVGSHNSLYSIDIQNKPCCSFSSPSPEGFVSHASIWWDGSIDNAGQLIPEGIHGFVLGMYDCNNVLQPIIDDVNLHYIVVPFTSSIEQSNEITENTSSSFKNETNVIADSIRREREILETKIKISPNPTVDILKISGVDINESTNYQLFNKQGRMISNRLLLPQNGEINVRELASGTYYLRIYINNNYALKKFIKL